MRVLIVLHTPRSRHSAVYLGYEQTASYLIARGHTATIVTPDDFPRLRSWHARWYALVYPFWVARWFRGCRLDYDVVVWHSWTGWVSNVLGPRHAATITAFHGLEPLNYESVEREMTRVGQPYSLRYRLVHGRLIPLVLANSCRRSTLVFCLNQAEREYLVRCRWAAPEAIRVVGRGIAGAFFIERDCRPVARRMLFVGQWIERKGIAYLVEAFETLARARPDVELVCAGTLVSADAVRTAFAPDVRGRVQVRPTFEMSEAVDLYRQSDVFLFPSLVDGFGRALLEAMATATPIVTTPCGWAQDVLRSGESCVMIPVSDASALAKAAARLIDDAALRHRLGAAAQRAARSYESDQVNAQLASLLEEAMTTGGSLP
jgi:glycosyltransferase involved in cell wall biosynthesis